MRTYILTALYLIAIVAANLLVAAFGPAVAVVNAFVFIGLDLTTRDALHEAWRGRGLFGKMGMLIATGSTLSYALAHLFPGTLPPALVARVAWASLIAFAAAGAVDALCYHLLRRYAYLWKVNGSNVAAAAVDSLLFLPLAFGGWPILVMLGQFAAKVMGGAVWSWVLGQQRAAHTGEG